VLQARKQADSNRVAIANGRDPFGKKAKTAPEPNIAPDTTPTFEEAARKVHALNAPTWRNGKHNTSWIQSLEKHVFPIFGNTPIDEVGSRDVLGILLPIWHTKAETAHRLRGRIRKVFDWAVSSDYAEVNPAGEKIKGALPKHKRLKEHLKALPYQDVPAAYKTIYWSDAQRETIAAFLFLILTAARSVEVRSATWDQIDWTNEVWTIPGESMKSGKEHRQPLSYQALLILHGMKMRQSRESNLIFARPDGGMQSENTFLNRCRKDEISCHPHGMRSSFRDWAEEQEQVAASYTAIELCLAHDTGGTVERAYRRTDLLDRRRELLQAWADHVAGYDRPPF
jgi:integrase